MHFGLGTGGIGFTERGHGVKIAHPLARAKETVLIVTGLLTNERFSYNGQWFQVQDFSLREGPIDGPIFIYLSALNPKMVGLASRIADGLITNCLTEEVYEAYYEVIQREAESAGRDPVEVRLLTLAMTAGEDDASVDAMRRAVAFYLASPHYYRIVDITGYGTQAKQIQALWQERDFAGASRLVTDTMIEKFAIIGSPEQRRKKLQWMMDRNIYPIIYPIPRPDFCTRDYFHIIEQTAYCLTTAEARLGK